MKNVTEKYAEELARTVAIIIHEEILKGTVLQTTDEAIEIAKAFIRKYPLNTDWEKIREETDLDWDETIVIFTEQLTQT